MSTARLPSAPVSLATFFFLYFATVGVLLPFLPAYLRSLGLSSSEIGIALALSPGIAAIAPGFWSRLSDSLGRPDRILAALATGSALAFSLLFFTSTFAGVVAALGLYACFATSVTPLVDALTLDFVAREGRSFARLRMFGSLGFVASSVLFGLYGAARPRSLLWVALSLMVAYGAWTFALPRGHRTERPRSEARSNAFGLRALLVRGDLRLFLSATALHWIACAPWHGSLALHVADLGLAPSVVGLSAGLGVTAEIVMLFVHPRLFASVPPARLLWWALAASVLRWAGMAFTSDPAAIVGLSALHGMTFGAFYVAAVAHMASLVPQEYRASGQALFASVTFGLGGLVGYSGAGFAYAWMGGNALFGVAAGLEALAAALAWRVSKHPG